MMTKTKGFRVTGVAGLKHIDIDPVITDALSYAEITIVDNAGMMSTYDQEGLDDLIEGLTKALNLTRHLNEELERNGK